jgi:hypothetical protein
VVFFTGIPPVFHLSRGEIPQFAAVVFFISCIRTLIEGE